MTPTGSALEGTNEVTYWTCRLIDSEERAAEETLVGSLEECATFLEGHRAFLVDFVATGGTAALRVGWFLYGRSAGETLESSLLERLGRLEVDLMLDVYERDCAS